MAPTLEALSINAEEQVKQKQSLDSASRKHAQELDDNDNLRHFRDEFIIPSKRAMKRKALSDLSEYPSDRASRSSSVE